MEYDDLDLNSNQNCLNYIPAHCYNIPAAAPIAPDAIAPASCNGTPNWPIETCQCFRSLSL